MDNKTQNIIGAIAIIFILGVVAFANNVSDNNKESQLACYSTINNVASGMSEARLVKTIKACDK